MSGLELFRARIKWYSIKQVRLLADRVLLEVRGKSGQYRERQLLTVTGGNPRESATETKLPSHLARVKRVGQEPTV